MGRFIDFNPVRSLSALLALGAAIIAFLAIVYEWDTNLVAAVQLIWSMLVAFAQSFFVHNAVTPVDGPWIAEKINEARVGR